MRSDIQCLRGIAILLVFMFHLFPNIFVNGFLGVDIFFVISGFLMAKNLTRSELRTINDFVQFYYRRFRRILPLYFLVIAITLVMVHLYLGDYLWEMNNRYSIASLFLVTNQLVIHDQGDYFNQFFTSTTSINAFLHLWSLSLEMQFYLLVPFIFFGLQTLKHDYLKLIAVALITLFGFTAFAFVQSQFAINFMFLRLWQFSAGFIAMFWNKIKDFSKKGDPSHQSIFQFSVPKNDIFTFSLLILGCCLLPNKLDVLVLRPFVTMATAFIIASENQNCQILSSEILGYIGDISYVMYLVHWPLIAIFPPYSAQNYVFLIVVTFLLSICLHNIYEKRYLELDWKALVPFIFVLIVGNVLLQNSVREHSFWNITYPLELQGIVEMNKAQLPVSWMYEIENMECIDDVLGQVQDDKKMEYRVCKGGKGNISIMMVGNSYLMSLRNPIRNQFNYNYSEFRTISLAEGYGIYADTSVSQIALDVFKRDVEKHKPDVLFILARYHSRKLRSPIENDDATVKQINENIEFYEKYVKKIYILDSHPLYQVGFADYFIQTVVNRPEALETLHLDRRKADKEMQFVKKRFSMVKCTKCKFFDLSHVFLEGDKYLTFDRDALISYADNTVHISTAGLKRCNSAFQKIAREILDAF